MLFETLRGQSHFWNESGRYEMILHGMDPRLLEFPLISYASASGMGNA